MPHRRESLKRGAVGPERLSPSFRHKRYAYDNFSQEPLLWQKPPATGVSAVVAGTDATENLFFTGSHTFEFRLIGGASDVQGPVLATDGGYDWRLDHDTLGEGVEINFGGIVKGHPRNYLPGVEDFFARILLIVDNASGVDIVFGARAVAAYQAALTSYVDIAGIEILGDSSSTTAAFSVVSNLGNTGSTDYVSTALTAAGLEDATAVELEVRSIGNKVRFYINGKEWASDLRPAWAASEYVSPVLRILQTTDLASQIKTLAFECGLLDDRGENALITNATATA